MKKYGLGRIPSPFDERDYNLRRFIHKGALLEDMPEEVVWDFPSKSLDQGETPHCVGFTMADFGINLPVHTPYTNEDGHSFYYLCKIEDGEPRMENGSTMRSLAKALLNEGKIEAYAFAPDMATIKWWLLNKGSIMVGTAWTSDMFSPDENYIIRPTGSNEGGHAYLLNEWTKDGYIGIQNSWGDQWGDNGKAYISAEDFEKLFIYDGEAVTAVELSDEQPEPQPEESQGWLLKLLLWLIELIKGIFS